MNEQTSYIVNSQSIVHEAIDGEVVIANISNGNYYSLAGTGTDIWELLIGNKNSEQIINNMSGRYLGDKTEVSSAVLDFINKLEGEGIISQKPATETLELEPAPETPINTATTFTKPSLEKFTDMQALLMLDPIHEVDVTGWPNKN